ncbi:uncharacterized protein TRAVEDRAFT_74287 [Trametes versicolor FP-101664 SS1]|uniref:uncharacterized protein n=1 Tax=Trametes versicolor (strain FP-101664) TaxID=717944 RepID=UPI0004621E99|nr:uncharacterized protein TRAVEDRAFT_74287 [Trametes versicolor FP-101664 SS1]EIW53954.1 hypothetical protein TRAVEDRAFT_74287 [Trametes versicolor FP-101664 SS1]
MNSLERLPSGARRVQRNSENEMRNKILMMKAECDNHQRTLHQLGATVTSAKEYAERCKTERDEIAAAMRRYNPEVIHRQEELHLSAEVAVRHNPLVGKKSKQPANIRDIVRQELSYLVPLKPPKKKDGVAKLLEFQKWLTGRTIFPAAIEGAEGAAVVSKDTSRLNFNIDDARLCQDPVLFIHDRLFWCTLPEQHGLLVCPEFQYGPSLAYSGDIWTKIAEWRACVEQKREVFYERDGLVHYAGTYICHSGPSSLQLKELGKLKTEILVRAIARETRKAKKNKKAERELVTIEQLYREGALTVHVLGLERIGFNSALYTRLASRYRKSQPAIPRAPIVPVQNNDLPEPYYEADDLPEPYYEDDDMPEPYHEEDDLHEPYYGAPPVQPAPMADRNHWYYGAQQVPVAPVPGPSHAPYVAPPTAPVAGPSRVQYAAAPRAPIASNLIPPPSYIANIAQKWPKRAREDDGFDRLERAAKYGRASSSDYGRENDEGYLFHLGSNYYRDTLGDDDY